MARMMRAAANSSRGANERPTPIGNEDIAQVAYELFQRRGGVHGHDQEDWLEAERIVRERQRSTARR